LRGGAYVAEIRGASKEINEELSDHYCNQVREVDEYRGLTTGLGLGLFVICAKIVHFFVAQMLDERGSWSSKIND
jgi:hypothetical protein